MKVALFLFLFVYISFSHAQSSCELQGSFTCSGSDIIGINFGDDEDDDFFEYYASNGSSDDSDNCTVIQIGTYDVSDEDDSIEVEFEIDDDECLIGGNENQCDCIDELSLTVSNNCATVSGPNGMVCEVADSKRLFL